MRVEYDYDTCIGMFQCVEEWDAFERDENAGKADLADSTQSSEDPDVYVREIPDDAELDAKFAARACPVEAIRVLDDDGDQLVP
jgi:ferredoxin